MIGIRWQRNCCVVKKISSFFMDKMMLYTTPHTHTHTTVTESNMALMFQGPFACQMLQTGSTTRTANSCSTTSIGDGSSFDVCNLQNLGFIPNVSVYIQCNMCTRLLTNDMTDCDLRMVSIGGGRSTFLLRSFRSWMTVGISLKICFLDNGGLFALVNSTLTSATHAVDGHYVWNCGYDDGWFDVESGFIFIRNDS